MRCVLVFSPAASPTYVPLSLATLAASARKDGDPPFHPLVDSNLLVWRQLAAAHPDGSRLVGFLHNDTRLFYDREAYLSFNRIWDQLRLQMDALVAKAKWYLEKEDLDAGLESFFQPTVEHIMIVDPELIGFSVLFLDQLCMTLALAKYIRRRDGSQKRRIILGGASLHALDATELMMACPDIDGLVMGEGEAAYQTLLQNEPLEKVPGLLYRSSSGLKQNRHWAAETGQAPGAADFSALPLADYFNPSPVLPVGFSRDCPWRKCRFCAHNFSFLGYRKKSVRSFVDELEQLHHRFQVKHFYFADQYIGAADLTAIATALIERDVKISYQVMCRPLKDYTPERLNLISRSGCRWISWGIETGSQRLLNLVRKGTVVQDIETVVHDAKTAGISNLAMMIFGLPTSSDIDLWQTFGLLDNVQNDLDAICASAFVLFQSTSFAKQARRFGLEIIGAEKLIETKTGAVCSSRIKFKEVSQNGPSRPPRGAYEIIAWEKRRPWMNETSFMEQLPCEHFLLYSRKQYETNLMPQNPLSHPA